MHSENCRRCRMLACALFMASQRRLPVPALPHPFSRASPWSQCAINTSVLLRPAVCLWRARCALIPDTAYALPQRWQILFGCDSWRCTTMYDQTASLNRSCNEYRPPARAVCRSSIPIAHLTPLRRIDINSPAICGSRWRIGERFHPDPLGQNAA